MLFLLPHAVGQVLYFLVLPIPPQACIYCEIYFQLRLILYSTFFAIGMHHIASRANVRLTIQTSLGAPTATKTIYMDILRPFYPYSVSFASQCLRGKRLAMPAPWFTYPPEWSIPAVINHIIRASCIVWQMYVVVRYQRSNAKAIFIACYICAC